MDNYPGKKLIIVCLNDYMYIGRINESLADDENRTEI